MNTITIEFFHDVICSFCFPMSYRMRKIQKRFPQIQIIHRSFALVKSEQDFIQMFGSRTLAKDEILTHWEHANQNDDMHRFRIDAMRKEVFPFPISIKPLIACKAALLASGENAYWDVFDALQMALFTQAKNVEQQDIIEHCVKQCNVNFEQWKKYYKSEETLQKVEEDFQLANKYGIHSVPSLVINGKSIINGALPFDVLISAIEKESTLVEGAACQLSEDGIDCK